MRRFLILLFFVLSFCFSVRAEARKLALLVGVDDYANVPSLRCCVNDIKSLKAALIKVGFKENDIQVLMTGGSVRDLPTKEKIEQSVAQILAAARSMDLVFIAFSGHGVRDGSEDYFCPTFADPGDIEKTCVSIKKVMDDLAKCEAKFKWMVVDACRNNPRSRDARAFQVIPSPPQGIALFQSCSKDEKSYEEDRKGGNGYFTKNFVAALSGAADVNGDGKLTLLEVCEWTAQHTKDEVEKEKKEVQTPYLNILASDFTITENLNITIAKEYAAQAQKAFDEENYELAKEKYDAALALCPWFEQWKRERDLAQRFIDKRPIEPTSRDSFEWDGTKITKFIGKEKKVVIPEGVKEIGATAFYDCSSLTSVVIPEGVTVIGEQAFFGCRSLTSVVIPEGVTEIGDGAFYDCSSLTSVVIPEGVTEIGSGAFLGCSSLTSVVIPEGVTEIGSGAFYDCSSLTSVVIPEGVTVIGEQAFSGCSSLTSVVIPKGVKEIERATFAVCSSLTSVMIPEGVTVIGEQAFEGCSSLTSVVIPEGVTEIGDGAFFGCRSLTSVVIPDSVEEIGRGAFAGCTALKEWSISSGHPYFKTDGTGLLTKDGKKLVACLTFAKEYQIPEGVTEIEVGAFYGCSSLTSVVFPKGVTEIGGWAFSGCSSLTSVVIPESVTEIESGAFDDCPKLTIHAPKGSKAEEYAKENNIPFEAK